MQITDYSHYVGKKILDVKTKSTYLITGAYHQELSGDIHLVFNYVHQDKHNEWGSSIVSEKLSSIEHNPQFEIID